MTSLSVGLIIKNALLGDSAVAAITDKVFPVVSEENSRLPYICFRRGNSDIVSVKTASGADTCTVEVLCYAATYEGSIELAEAARMALEGKQLSYSEQGSSETLIARSIRLENSDEAWQDDAYVQALTFSIKINNY